MHHAPFVGGLEGVGDLAGNRQRFVEPNRTVRDPVRQRVALDELEHDRRHAVGLFEPVDRADVWMVDAGQQLRLAVKSRESIGVRHGGVPQHLDGHVALQFRVACTVHVAHAAAAERRENLVRSESHSGAERHR